jgi:hypothetical protein
MSHITQQAITKAFEMSLTQRVKKTGEVAITFNHQHEQFALLNREEMNGEMKRWKTLRKQGLIKMKRYNSKTAEYKGKSYHFLTLQPYKDGKLCPCNFDPMGLFILGEMVSGYIYAFTNKANRDAVEKYVMGKYDETEQQ